jgi:ParB family protein of integrating conjugative element (PFGI_1 class)
MSVTSTFPIQDEASTHASNAPYEEVASASPSDPEVETPMIVTLDCLKPYDLDPRVMRNPKYEEIKASIRQRGLDAPPPITRRPGEPYFRIRNGGNTRLSILRELWSETKNEQYFHLTCMFRPWPKRGEIISLTGHLAENEMRGGLTFIERALGIEKARELYELECGSTLSQSELSRRLTSDGYPVHQSHISRMRDAVHYLLPAIPNVLYGGLGRHQVERLAVLRRSCAKIWDEHAKTKMLTIDFASLFQEALMLFDGATADFSIDRAQDEVIGQMAHYLGVDYDTLALASEAGEKREQALTHVPMPPSAACPRKAAASDAGLVHPVIPSSPPTKIVQAGKEPDPPGASDCERLQSIQALVARHTGDEPSLTPDVLPFSQGSLFPISDIWNIDPALDEPQRLRIHISQFAREICQDVAQADVITEVDEGIGFRCCLETVPEHPSPLTLIALLETLTTNSSASSIPMEIGPLLLGTTQPNAQAYRLSDANLIKLFRLIRLARRLIDLKSELGTHHDMHPKEDL